MRTTEALNELCGKEKKDLAELCFLVEDYSLNFKKPLKVKLITSTFRKWVCKQSSCGFKITASYKKKRRLWRINKAVPHSCRLVCAKASVAWVARKFKTMIANDPKTKPDTIIRRARSDSGAIVSRYVARKAINHVVSAGEIPEEEYGKLAAFVDAFVEANPGSIGKIALDEGRFERLFVLPGACSKGFKYLLPVTALDACHLSGPRRGILFSSFYTNFRCAVGCSGSRWRPLIVSNMLCNR